MRAQLVVGGDLVLHPPEVLDRVPVAILDGRLQPAHQRRIGLAAHLLDRGVQRGRGGELGEVEHPVDLPGAVVDVDRVLEQDREVEQRGGPGVELVEPREIALELGAQPVAPPVEEVLGVGGEHPAQVGADLAGVLGIAGHSRDVARLVLGRLGADARVGGHRGGVDVAVDVLGDPVRRERRAEAAEHVVARQPPAADVEEERRHRVGAVEVVEDPEELLLALLPFDREVVRSEEGAQRPVGLAGRHGPRLLS